MKKVKTGGRVIDRETKNGAPEGVDVEGMRETFIRDARGGTTANASGMKETMPGESGGHSDHHHDDHHGDTHHHHYYDDDDVYIDIDINIWSHDRYCPTGWWYTWSDYDGDGYLDYVCTNGSYSVYWYGWSGSYWDCTPWYGYYPYRYSYRWWRYSIPDTYRGVVYGTEGDLLDEPSAPVPVAEVPEEMPPAVPLTAVEVARLEMSIGNPDIAIEAYRAHINTYPDDWYAVRELGIAMLRNGQRGDGIAMIGYAHSQDPLLAYDSIPVELFESDSRMLRDVLVSVVGWGHRNPSASAWLTVAVLMQAEGRTGPALRMIERAEQNGLGLDVADQMRDALTQP